MPREGEISVDRIRRPPLPVHGRVIVTTSGTAVAFSATNIPLRSGITVKALSINTQAVWVGAAGVSGSDGFELLTGEWVFVEIADLADLYLNANVSGEGVTYIGG